MQETSRSGPPCRGAAPIPTPATGASPDTLVPTRSVLSVQAADAGASTPRMLHNLSLHCAPVAVHRGQAHCVAPRLGQPHLPKRGHGFSRLRSPQGPASPADGQADIWEFPPCSSDRDAGTTTSCPWPLRGPPHPLFRRWRWGPVPPPHTPGAEAERARGPTVRTRSWLRACTCCYCTGDTENDCSL